MFVQLTSIVAIVALALSPGTAQQCDGTNAIHPDYSAVLAPETSQAASQFLNLPGFTRSKYTREYALVTPESRVWSPNVAWPGSLTAHFVSRSSGAHFSMYLVRMKAGGQAIHELPSIAAANAPAANNTFQRFLLVLDGSIDLETETGMPQRLQANHFAFCPGSVKCRLQAVEDAGLVVFERQPGVGHESGKQVLTGVVDDVAELDTGPEMFALRKLLPQTPDFLFNIHIMDFAPGEHLVVKEVHYNQHGLLLLQGQGIYRLADSWYPVQAGDAIWMAPYVPQWYAALGKSASRYILYKDVTVDPLYDA